MRTSPDTSWPPTKHQRLQTTSQHTMAPFVRCCPSFPGTCPKYWSEKVLSARVRRLALWKIRTIRSEMSRKLRQLQICIFWSLILFRSFEVFLSLSSLFTHLSLLSLFTHVSHSLFSSLSLLIFISLLSLTCISLSSQLAQSLLRSLSLFPLISDVSSSSHSERVGQYSSLCGCALGLILGRFDIVEVDVQDREQVNSGEGVEAREREEEDRTRKQSTLKHVTSWMTCRWSACAGCDTLSHNVMCAECQTCREEVSCEVYLSTPSVGYSGSLSTVNETNCNKKKIKKNMNSLPIPFRLVPPRCAWRVMPSTILTWMDRLFNLFSWFVV